MKRIHPVISCCVAIAGIVAIAPTAHAQVDSVRSGVSSASCTYDACALRIEENNIVRGSAGQRVTHLGALANVMQPIAWNSDQARRLAGSYQSRHRSATLIKALALGVSVTGLVITFDALKSATEETTIDPDDGSEVTQLVVDRNRINLGNYLIVGSIPLGGIGGLMDASARRQLSRAVWWHNREIPRDAASTSPPSH